MPVSQLPVNTPGGVAGLGEDGKVGTDQLPINTPGGVAGIGTDGKVGTGQLPVNTPGGVAGLGADGKMDTDQLPINVPNGIPTLGADGKLSADSLPQVGMTAQIVVTAPTGSTVTATLGTKVHTATESGGKWTFDVEDYGTYTIKATKNGQTATDTVTVSVVQQYTATLSYFTATIHVSIDSGSTVTCTKGEQDAEQDGICNGDSGLHRDGKRHLHHHRHQERRDGGGYRNHHGGRTDGKCEAGLPAHLRRGVGRHQHNGVEPHRRGGQLREPDPVPSGGDQLRKPV